MGVSSVVLGLLTITCLFGVVLFVMFYLGGGLQRHLALAIFLGMAAIILLVLAGI